MLAASFAAAWFSANRWENLHEWAGYVAGGLVVARVAFGFFGVRYARFSQFVRSPKEVAAYLKALAIGRERRFIGHNPAGGAMIVALLAGILLIVATGWALTTDAFWGSVAAQEAHALVAHSALILIGLHLLGVAFASFRHRENLVWAMIFGVKRAPEAGDVD
jgi:cytochrome b